MKSSTCITAYMLNPGNIVLGRGKVHAVRKTDRDLYVYVRYVGNQCTYQYRRDQSVYVESMSLLNKNQTSELKGSYGNSNYYS